MLMQGFREAVQSNLTWFEGTKLIVISNTLWVGEKVCHTCAIQSLALRLQLILRLLLDRCPA